MASDISAETKIIIGSLITSNPLRTDIQMLCNDFLNIVGYPLPYKQLGFKTVEDYLLSIPDTCKICGSGPYAEVVGIEKPNSAHISLMVANDGALMQQFPPKIKTFKSQVPPQLRSFSSSAQFHYNRKTFPFNINATLLVPRSAQSQTSQKNVGNNIKPLMQNYEHQQHYQTSVPNVAREYHRNHTQVNYMPDPVNIAKFPSISPIHNMNNISMKCDKMQARKDCLEENSLCDKIDRLMDDHNDCSEALSIEYDDYRCSVPSHIQTNLKKLMKQFPDGIYCTNLPTEYQKMFRKRLRFEKYNYRSLIDLCSNLPDVFNVVRTSSYDFYLFDKNYPLPAVKHYQLSANELTDKELVASTSVIDEIPRLNWSRQAVIPPDVIRPGDRIPSYWPANLKVGERLDIELGEIYDISKFWMYEVFGPLNILMDNLNKFFCDNNEPYRIPQSLLEVGLFCTSTYLGKYHRCVILNLQTHSYIKVYFVDYGTVDVVTNNQIWYLPKRFSEIPCQAIRARLSSILPPYENETWSVEAVNRFSVLVTNTNLIAEVTDIDEENFIIEIYLADVSNTENIFYINDVLQNEGHAYYLDQKRKPTLNDPNCLPTVEYIHLFPTFDELEMGHAPGVEEMKYILQTKMPLHWYMPQYFDIKHQPQDFKAVEKAEEKLNLSNSAELSIKAKALRHKIKAIHDASQAKGQPNSDDKKNRSQGSCNKQRILNLMRREKEKDISGDSGSVQTKLTSIDGQIRKSNTHGFCNKQRILDLMQKEDDTHKSECVSVIQNKTLSVHNLNILSTNNSTNPFLNHSVPTETNPFWGTNPFLSDIEKIGPQPSFNFEPPVFPNQYVFDSQSLQNALQNVYCGQSGLSYPMNFPQ